MESDRPGSGYSLQSPEYWNIIQARSSRESLLSASPALRCKSTYHYLHTRFLLLCGYFLKSRQLPTSFLTSSWDSAGKDLTAFLAHLAGHYVSIFPGFLMAECLLPTPDFSPSPIHGLGECHTTGHSSSHQAQSICNRSSYFGGS